MRAPYFDAAWYTGAHPEARRGDPREHYLAHARQRSFNPNPAFDGAWYSERFMAAGDGRSPLAHYLQVGCREGRPSSPWFDPHWYQKIYSDVARAGVEPLRHYLEWGAAELRSPGPYFDASWYVKSRGDDPSVRLNPLAHYLEHAGRAGFEPNPLGATPEGVDSPGQVSALFDPDWYLDHYRDVADAGVNPVWHYLEAGRFEGRRPNLFFDPAYYVRQRPGLALEDALGDYVLNGRSNGCDPCPYFSSAWYAQRYLAAAPEECPLRHYLEQGSQQGLQPHPLFDEARYLASNRDIARLVREGTLKSGYHHFVQWGTEELTRGLYRHFSFAWGDHELDFDPGAYLTDNPDVLQAVANGKVASGLEHLFAQGWREAGDGLRAIYSARHAVKLIRSIKGNVRKKGERYLCLFAHYDRDNVVDPYVLIYLKALKSQNVDIVFITAVNDDAVLAPVKPLVSQILIKNEAGRDFGSWWLALVTLGLDCGAKYDRVILANDSIYFPVRPVAPLFADMEAKGYNLYGLSDSRDLDCYHLQSFFLAFDAKAQQDVFPAFVERFERNYLLTKWGQIREYELGLTQLAQAAGLSVGAYFSIADVREDVLRDPSLKRWDFVRSGLDNVNPTHDLWDLMIGQCGWPGLKLELIRDNPKRAPRLETLSRLIGDGDVPIEVIEAHQKRSKQTQILVSPAKTVDTKDVAVIRQLQGQGRQTADRLVLFAHYDPEAVIDPHIVFQVKALARAGCAIAFITSVNDDRELAKVAPYARDIIVKTDAGRDFGSWDLAIKALKHEFGQFGSVIWMNDSTYFPLFDPVPMFKTMESRGLDFWGIVDSHSVTWHIMSWFWSFGRKAISEGWFDWYLNEYRPAHTKWAQIHNYEMRVPRLMKASGMKTDVFIPAEKVRAHILDKYPDHPRMEVVRRGDFNTAHDFWRESITDFKCPALKVELVRDNPLGVELSSLLDVIGRHTEYDPSLIKGHMRRLKTAHLPPPSGLSSSIAFPQECSDGSR